MFGLLLLHVVVPELQRHDLIQQHSCLGDRVDLISLKVVGSAKVFKSPTLKQGLVCLLGIQKILSKFADKAIDLALFLNWPMIQD